MKEMLQQLFEAHRSELTLALIAELQQNLEMLSKFDPETRKAKIGLFYKDPVSQENYRICTTEFLVP